MSSSAENKSFEDTLSKLENIVSSLEKGDLPLDKSLKMFESGIEMYNECKDFLENAQSKIKVLTDSLKEEELEE